MMRRSTWAGLGHHLKPRTVRPANSCVTREALSALASCCRCSIDVGTQLAVMALPLLRAGEHDSIQVRIGDLHNSDELCFRHGLMRDSRAVESGNFGIDVCHTDGGT